MKRRALSTVVGAAFFVIVMASTISYVAYSMNLIDDLARSIDTKQDENLNKQNEEFKITDVTVTTANKFDVSIANTGNIPVKITRLYVENTTDSNWNATKYEINTEIAPGETQSGIALNTPLTYVGTESYNFNFVTDRGNTKTVTLNSGGSEAIFTNLYALPDAVATSFNTVLLYEIVNNSTGQLINLQPSIDVTPICATCQANAQTNWYPQFIPSLQPGELGTFQRSYKLTGQDGDLISFNASLVNAFPGVWDEELVRIQIVKEAEEAGVSITAQGIGEASSFSADVLVLHEETLTIPNGWYQMFSAKTDGGNNGGLFEPEKDQHFTWFTNNSSETISVPNDNWDVVMHYRSDPLPSSFNTGAEQADLIYHFEGGSYPGRIDNSQGSSDRDLEPGDTCPGIPDLVTTGMNNTNAYLFVAANQDCYQSIDDVGPSDSNHIDRDPDSTALWFKTVGQVGAADQYLVEWSESGANPEHYRISLLSNAVPADRGKIEFDVRTNTNSYITCTSTNQYDDGNWHHVLVTRYDDGGSNQACRIFIDRHKNATSGLDEIIYSSSGNINDDVSTGGRWVVGSNWAQTGNFFNGYIDDIIHWNGYQVTEEQSLEIAKTSFGDNAHHLQFTMYRADVNGNSKNPVLYATTNHTIPFYDSFGGGVNDDSAYGYYNSTMLDVRALAFVPGERLNFTMSHQVGDVAWEPLNIDIKFDDEGLIVPYPTSLHAPQEPQGPFPGFSVFDVDDDMRFNFENGGIRGFFFTYAGTRIVFNATDSTCADISASGFPCVYGGIPHYINDTDADHTPLPDVDSINFPVGTTGWIEFHPARSVPSDTPGKGDPIQCGTYDGAVWVEGYDDIGEPFQKTFDLGIVTFIKTQGGGCP